MVNMKKVLQLKKNNCEGSTELLHLKVANGAFPLQRFLLSQIDALFPNLRILFYLYIVSFTLLQNCK